MSPLCETTTHSLSPSHRFKPSLTCIAEEEPRAVAVRRITVPSGPSTEQFQVEIPIYDVNIYEPAPPTAVFSASYQRLLSEMEKYIQSQTNAQKYKEMAKTLQLQFAVEQAESRRLSKSNFTNRDWYWYSEQTRMFVDEPISRPCEMIKKWNQNQSFDTVSTSSSVESPEFFDDGFDLNADF